MIMTTTTTLLISVAISKRHNDLVCRVISMIDICPISLKHYLKVKKTLISNLPLQGGQPTSYIRVFPGKKSFMAQQVKVTQGICSNFCCPEIV